MYPSVARFVRAPPARWWWPTCCSILLVMAALGRREPAGAGHVLHGADHRDPVRAPDRGPRCSPALVTRLPAGATGCRPTPTTGFMIDLGIPPLYVGPGRRRVGGPARRTSARWRPRASCVDAHRAVAHRGRAGPAGPRDARLAGQDAARHRAGGRGAPGAGSSATRRGGAVRARAGGRRADQAAAEARALLVPDARRPAGPAAGAGARRPVPRLGGARRASSACSQPRRGRPVARTPATRRSRSSRRRCENVQRHAGAAARDGDPAGPSTGRPSWRSSTTARASLRARRRVQPAGPLRPDRACTSAPRRSAAELRCPPPPASGTRVVLTLDPAKETSGVR